MFRANRSIISQAAVYVDFIDLYKHNPQLRLYSIIDQNTQSLVIFANKTL